MSVHINILKNIPDKPKRPQLPLLLIFILFSIAIIIAGYVYLNHESGLIKKQRHAELSAIVKLKTDQILKWRDERIGDANVILHNINLAEEIDSWMNTNDIPNAKVRIKNYVNDLINYYDYSSVLFFDSNYRLRRLDDSEKVTDTNSLLPYLKKVVITKNILLTDIHVQQNEKKVHIDIVIPIYKTSQHEDHIGFMILQINPNKYLFPIIQSWPNESKTSETMLIRRENDSIIFLNELKYKKNTALNYKIPITKTEIATVQGALGYTGIFEGKDYRGVDILAYITKIPETTWIMVAKVDQNEVYSAINYQAIVTFIIIVLLILSFGIATYTFWKHQQVNYLTILRESEELFMTMFKSTPVPTTIANLSTRTVVDINPATEKLMGYSREEVAGKLADNFDVWADLNEKRSAYEMLYRDKRISNYEFQFKTRNGKYGTALYSAERIHRTDSDYILSTFIDITEIKDATKKILKSETKYRSTLDNMMEGAQIIDFDWCYLYINHAAEIHNRRSSSELIGKKYADMWPGIEQTEVYAAIKNCLENRINCRMENLFVFQDGKHGWFDISIQSVPEGVFILSIDITSRKELELNEKKLLERFDLATKSAKIGVWDWDIINNQLIWDDLMYELYGIKKEDFAGAYEAWLQGLHPDDLATSHEISQMAVRGENEYNTEFRIIWPDKSIHFLKAYGNVIRDEVGNPVRMIGVNFDITERKRAEDLLKISENKLRRFYDSGLMGVIYWNTSGQIVEANDKFLDMIGYSKEELNQGRIDWINMTPKEYAQRDIESLNELNELGYNKKPFIKEYIRKDGKRIPILLAGAFIDDEKKNGVAFVLDITEQKKAEEEIIKLNSELEKRVAERTAELADLYNNAPCGYHSLDSDGVILKINDTELKWFGYSREELEGKVHFVDLISEETKDVFFKNFPIFKKQGWINDVQFDVVRKDGSVLPILLSATTVYDENGNHLYSRSTLSDHTERKRAEKLLLEAYTKLEEANKELEAFSYSVSHDLRAPLRALDGFARILLEDYNSILDAEGQRLLNIIIYNAKTMGQLIDDLLAFSRISRQGIIKTEVNMYEMVKSTFQEMVGERESKVEFKIDHLPNTQGDASMIRQVWRNLIGNAIKFSSKSENPTVEVGTIEDGKTIYFVKDNGVGFKMKFAEKLFGVFQRLHSTKEFEGTGVGLAIVHRIITRHGGKIWAESQENNGATFYFTLDSRSN